MTTAAKQVKRIQRKRTKGYRLPDRTLCISRPGIWGNPYPLDEFGDLSLPLFRNTLRGVWNPTLLDGRPDLLSRAYDLHHEWLRRFNYRVSSKHPLEVLRLTLANYDFIACWCKETDECHGDTMIDLAYS